MSACVGRARSVKGRAVQGWSGHGKGVQAGLGRGGECRLVWEGEAKVDWWFSLVVCCVSECVGQVRLCE